MRLNGETPAENPPAKDEPGFDIEDTGRLMARAFAVNSNSAWNREQILRWYPAAPNDIRVVYYGTAVLDPGTVGPSLLEGLRRPYILCVARIAEYKGLDVLIMAFAELSEHCPELQLILCGADHSAGALQRFIRSLGLENRVLWMGQIPHNQILELMGGCLFFVLPSRRESLGGSIIEAMNAGKAVVATRVGGIPEIVRDEVEGLLIEPKDVRGLAAAMVRLARDGAFREKLGARGLERSASFTWDSAISSYLSSYREFQPVSPESKVGCVFWGSSADATTLAMLGNFTRGLVGREVPFCACLRRSRWSEPFRSRREGWALYTVGIPPGSALRPLEPFVVLAQLFWISRAEKVGLWHCFLLRYRELRGLIWFTELSRTKLMVSLC